MMLVAVAWTRLEMLQGGAQQGHQGRRAVRLEIRHQEGTAGHLRHRHGGHAVVVIRCDGRRMPESKEGEKLKRYFHSEGFHHLSSHMTSLVGIACIRLFGA